MQFTAGEVARLFQINRRSVVNWGEKGVVVPDVQDAFSRGVHRVYSPSNLVQMALVRELFDMGMTRKDVKALLDGWRKVAEKRPGVRRWFDPMQILKPGVEWLIILDDRDWFLKWDGSGYIRTGTDKILLHEEEKLPTARRLRAVNLTKIKETVAKVIQ